MYREFRPDVTIMDINMPRKSGLQAISEIIALDEDAKIIICSSCPPDRLNNDLYAAGTKGVLHKPFTVERVLDIVNGLFENENRNN
jgi:two-component system chemotaxis response regulator CheY